MSIHDVPRETVLMHSLKTPSKEATGKTTSADGRPDKRQAAQGKKCSRQSAKGVGFRFADFGSMSFGFAAVGLRNLLAIDV